MRRIIIFFTTRRFTGMTGNTVIGIKIETVLLITIRIRTDRAIAVYIKTLAKERVVFLNRLDGLAITVMCLTIRII